MRGLRQMWMGAAYRDADAVNAKVAKAEDAGPVSHHADGGVGVRPIPEDGAHGLALLDGDVEGLWAGVEGGVLEADVANGGSVDERHELLDIVDEDAVEEIDVVRLEGREVEVLVNWRLARVDHLHGAEDLCVHVLHDVRDETGEVLLHTLLWGERCAWWRVN